MIDRQEMKPCPPCRHGETQHHSVRMGGRTSDPTGALSSLPLQDPGKRLGGRVICLHGVIFPVGSPTLQSLIPEGHFNSRGRRVHLLLNAGLASPSPGGCGAHRPLPPRAEPPPQPPAGRNLRHSARGCPPSPAIRNLRPSPAAECGGAGVTFGRIAVVAQETVVDFAGINVLLH